MSKLPCEVVRDLFPSYIDELTSEVTKKMMEEHVAECESCKMVLSSMKNPEAEPVDDKSKEEIDFLKKARKKNKKNIWIAVTSAVLVLVAVLFVKNYFVGTAVPNEYITCQVEVDGNLLTVSGAILDERLRISGIECEEQDGVVTLSFESVRRSPAFNGEFQDTFAVDEEITEVHLGDRILWARGKKISAVTSAVYQTRHPYVGDMPANGRTAAALGIGVVLGPYKNELQTSSEPYEWKFMIEEELTALPFMENYMEGCAHVMLAVVENLGAVTFEYTCAGMPMVMTITEESATSAARQDIKAVGKDIVALQNLMEKDDLLGMAYVVDYSQWNLEEKIEIDLVNLVEDDIFAATLTAYYDNEEVAFSQTMINTDESLLEKGDVISFDLLREDFSDESWKNAGNMMLGIMVEDENGKIYECVEKITVPLEFGYTYRYHLTGNAEERYHISQ